MMGGTLGTRTCNWLDDLLRFPAQELREHHHLVRLGLLRLYLRLDLATRRASRNDRQRQLAAVLAERQLAAVRLTLCAHCSSCSPVLRLAWILAGCGLCVIRLAECV